MAAPDSTRDDHEPPRDSDVDAVEFRRANSLYDVATGTRTFDGWTVDQRDREADGDE